MNDMWRNKDPLDCKYYIDINNRELFTDIPALKKARDCQRSMKTE